MIFQVTGLPRSGTAFLAAFLNLHPECFCHHDLAAERDDWKEYSEYLNRTWEFVGESSTYGWLPRAARPGAPTVLVVRDPVEVNHSLEKILGRTAGLDPLIKAQEDAKRWADQTGAFVIDFKYLFQIETLNVLWQHVFQGSLVPFPVEKAKLMVTMNTQRQDPKRAFGDARFVRQRLLTPCTDTKPS